MELAKLKKLCNEWNSSHEGFVQIVSAIDAVGLNQRELATEFEVVESTVSRWAHGVARPHPRIQKLIIASIEKRVSKILRSQGSGSGGSGRSTGGFPMVASPRS